MNSVNKTLYIPLYGKSYVSKKNIILKDEMAEKIWDAEGFELKGKSKSKWLAYYMGMRAAVFDRWTKEKLAESLKKLAVQMYELKEKEIGQGQPEGVERMRELERLVMLRVIDQKWMDHIDDMDRMRQGIGLHAYAQRDPLTEYKFAAYDMFDEMSEHIQDETLRILYRVRIQTEVKQEEPRQMFTNKDDSLAKQPKTRSEEKVGRNDPCPCGSGKKYKQCCGRNA